MEETMNLKSGLGIASFVVGIVGFLTGFIAIGIVFDVVAIILGLVAIISKKNKSGFAIAGLVIGLLGILIMIFLFNVFDNSDKETTTVTTEETIVIEKSKNDIKEENMSEPEEVDEGTLLDQLEIQEYSYENTIGDTLHFLVIKNNSNKTVAIDVNDVAYNASGEIIGANSGELDVLGSNCESIMHVYFDSVKDIEYYKYTLSVEEETYYDSVTQDIEVEVAELDDKVVITCTNNGLKAADFVEAYALFFNNGEIIRYGSTYIIDDDYELKSGASISEQIESYDSFDEVKVFITGRR